MDRQFREMGERIRKARRAKDLTQQDVADSLKVSVQSVSQWETGRTQPETDRLYDLAKILDASFDYLRTGTTKDGQTGHPGNYRNDLKSVLKRSAEIMPDKEWITDAFGDHSKLDDLVDGTVIAQYDPVGQLFAYYVDDEDMEPVFQMGDLVVLDDGLPIRVGDFVLALDAARRAVELREVRGTRLDDSDRLIVDLRAANPNFAPTSLLLDSEGNRILAVVAEHRRVRKRW